MEVEHPAINSPIGSRKERISSEKKVKRESWEWIKAFIIAAILVVLIRVFLFSPYIVEGASMNPNLATNERLIVNKLIYRFHPPQYGDIIVFHATEGKDYVKRVIAQPGDLVKVEGDHLFVNGIKIYESYIAEHQEDAKIEGRMYNMINFPETKVPEDSLFVMGDNRSNSKDSRSIDVGFVPYNEIVGRADLIFWPISNVNVLLD
jgi:signal peptidase I